MLGRRTSLDLSPQGGLNDQGLSFDGLSVPYKALITSTQKPGFPGVQCLKHICLFGFNFDGFSLHFFLFRTGDGQDALFVGGFDLVGFNPHRQPEAPSKGAIAPLHEVIIFLFFLAFSFFLTLNGENITGEWLMKTE